MTLAEEIEHIRQTHMSETVQRAIDVIRAAMRVIHETESPVPWQLVVGQWALESGYGKSTPNNNPFGHKATQGGPGPGVRLLETEEHFTALQAEAFLRRLPGRRLEDLGEVHGKPGVRRYKARDWFVAYESIEGAIRAHVRLLELPRYRHAIADWPTHENIETLATAIAAAGYATLDAKEYGRRIAGCMNSSIMRKAFLDIA